jgi:hypothetical protein
MERLEQLEQSNSTQINLTSQIVYDCLDPSPYYTKEPQFIESDQIDLGLLEDPTTT